MNDKEIKLVEFAPIDLTDRTNLLLVLAQEKPATHIEIYQNCILNHKTGIYELGSLEIVARETMSHLLDQLNLPYWLSERTLNNFDTRYSGLLNRYKSETFSVHVGKDETSLNALKNAKDSKDFGKALGFPETATMAYAGEIPKIEFGSDERDIYVPRGIIRHFAQFVLSKDHYKEELETAKRWHDTVKRTSPFLYEIIKMRYVAE